MSQHAEVADAGLNEERVGLEAVDRIPAAPRSGEGQRMGRAEGSNVWLAYGHFRNGILLTPVTAERVAGEIAGSSLN